MIFYYLQIKGTWDTINLNPSGHDLKTCLTTTKPAVNNYTRNDKCSNTTLTSLSSLRTLCNKYFQRNRTKNSTSKKESLSANEKALIIHEIAIIPKPSNEHRHLINQKRQSTTTSQGGKTNSLTGKSSLPSLSAPSHHHLRSSRRTTTATFTGQKRNLNDSSGEKKSPNDLANYSEEEQQLVRARLNTRTSSLPAARCISYYYYQHQTPTKTITTKAIIEDQHRDINNGHHYRLNSLTPERSRSQSHSSAQYIANGGIVTTDTEHSSSFDNALDDDHRHATRRIQASHVSAPYNSSRYSQRAVAQFLHERHKARLRRNQKASRMLGKNRIFLINFMLQEQTVIVYENQGLLNRILK